MDENNTLKNFHVHGFWNCLVMRRNNVIYGT